MHTSGSRCTAELLHSTNKCDHYIISICDSILNLHRHTDCRLSLQHGVVFSLQIPELCNIVSLADFWYSSLICWARAPGYILTYRDKPARPSKTCTRWTIVTTSESDGKKKKETRHLFWEPTSGHLNYRTLVFLPFLCFHPLCSVKSSAHALWLPHSLSSLPPLSSSPLSTSTIPTFHTLSPFHPPPSVLPVPEIIHLSLSGSIPLCWGVKGTMWVH